MQLGVCVMLRIGWRGVRCLPAPLAMLFGGSEMDDVELTQSQTMTLITSPPCSPASTKPRRWSALLLPVARVRMVAYRSP